MTALVTQPEAPPESNGVTNPLMILERAVTKGVDVETLERLMALAERHQDNQARVAFAQAMTSAQTEMPVVVKDAQNTQTNSLYARLETVAKQIKPVYLKHGFSLTFSQADSPREGYVRLVCRVRHREGHYEEHHLEGPLDDKGIKGTVNKTALHGTASTWTYLERLLTCRIFNVTIADSDNDGNQTKDTISDDQMVELNTLIEQTNADFNKFLAWAGVDSLDKMPVRKFKEAVTMLKAKLKTQAKGAAK